MTGPHKYALGALIALTLSLWLLAPALAFHNEPEGWDDTPWGTPAASFIQKDKELRKSTNQAQVRKILETQDVVLHTRTEAVGRSMAARWVFGAQGLHTVTLSWEDKRPEAYNAYKKVLEDLQQRWGAPDEAGPDGELVWKGWRTRASAVKKRTASGSGVEITLQRFEGKKQDRGPSHQKSILDEEVPGLPAGP